MMAKQTNTHPKPKPRIATQIPKRWAYRAFDKKVLGPYRTGTTSCAVLPVHTSTGSTTTLHFLLVQYIAHGSAFPVRTPRRACVEFHWMGTRCQWEFSGIAARKLQEQRFCPVEKRRSKVSIDTTMTSVTKLRTSEFNARMEVLVLTMGWL